MSTRAATTG